MAQTTPVRGDIGTNLAQHLQLARVAAGEGARVLVFPELSLTGYELDLAASLAFTESDERLAPVLAAISSRTFASTKPTIWCKTVGEGLT